MSKDQRKGRSPEDSAGSKRDRPQPRPATGLWCAACSLHLRDCQCTGRMENAGSANLMIHMTALNWCLTSPGSKVYRFYRTSVFGMVWMEMVKRAKLPMNIQGIPACKRVTTAAKSRKLNWHGLGTREMSHLFFSNWHLGQMINTNSNYLNILNGMNDI